MASRSYGPYRGCDIEVHVTQAKSHALGGTCHRFRVSWTVFSPDNPDLRVASFPERFDFLCDQDAFRYGANRAHTFIDSILTVPSKRRIVKGSNPQNLVKAHGAESFAPRSKMQHRSR
jgi:hypothetical protein